MRGSSGRLPFGRFGDGAGGECSCVGPSETILVLIEDKVVGYWGVCEVGCRLV
jgi:hypothetical protein